MSKNQKIENKEGKVACFVLELKEWAGLVVLPQENLRDCRPEMRTSRNGNYIIYLRDYYSSQLTSMSSGE